VSEIVGRDDDDQLGDNLDSALLDAVSALAAEFSKDRPTTTQAKGALVRDDLTLICFEYVTG
jgi:hypothetical protein